MYIKNTFIHFTKNGETLTARRGKIKTDKHQSFFIELYDVDGMDKKLRLHINDYLVEILNDISTDYIEVECKDAQRNFVKIYPLEVEDEPCVVFDEVSGLFRSEELVKASADLIRFKNELSYHDEIVDDLLERLQDYLLNQLGEVLLRVD